MIKFDLSNRIAIVTGGAQGFGLAITERFIEAGAKVVIWDIDESAAKKAIDKVNSKNLSYQIVDVSNFEIINKLLPFSINKWLNCCSPASAAIAFLSSLNLMNTGDIQLIVEP